MRLCVNCLAIGIIASVAACSPTLPPPAVKAAPQTAHQTAQAHLLLYPETDAAALLGRAVNTTHSGGWTMADARAPGCEVTVHRENAAFHTSRQVDVHSMTSLAGGYANFVSLEAKFGNANRANIDITNTQILHADMRGPCGAYVVDTVFVGHGKRDVVASAVAKARVGVHAGVVSASPGVDTGQKIVDALAWKQDEAYGFNFAKDTDEKALELTASMPSIVTEGDNVQVRFSSNEPAYRKRTRRTLYFLHRQSARHRRSGHQRRRPGLASRAEGMGHTACGARSAPRQPSANAEPGRRQATRRPVELHRGVGAAAELSAEPLVQSRLLRTAPRAGGRSGQLLRLVELARAAERVEERDQVGLLLP